MSPIDDELRAALHRRADVLTPSPDPLAGIESRARGLRRRRLAASVAGAAMAVAAVAVAVPLVQDSGPGRAPNQLATPGPTAVVADDANLDPEHPWAFRGTALSPGTLQHFRSEWAVKHPGSTLTPLFAQVYEISGQEEAVFVATGGDGPRYGFVSGSESGADFQEDVEYAQPLAALQFVVGGDEVERLLVVTAPDSTIVSSTSFFALAPGVNGSPLEEPVTYVVRDASGAVRHSGSAEPSDATPAPLEPVNLLDWPTRGIDGSALLPAAKQHLAESLQTTADKVELKVLFAGDTDSGVRYVMGQAWERGASAARTFSYSEGGTQGFELHHGKENAENAALLAFVLSNLPGTTVDHLVVIPQPRTGQVLYDDNATGSFRPVTGQDHLDGVVVIDRTPGDTDDRLQLLDGNGDLDHPTFEGPVSLLVEE